MHRPECEFHHPICMLAHELVNNLSVIDGRCDLLGDPDRPQEEKERQLQALRETAKSMAKRLHHHLCHPASMPEPWPHRRRDSSVDLWR